MNPGRKKCRCISIAWSCNVLHCDTKLKNNCWLFHSGGSRANKTATTISLFMLKQMSSKRTIQKQACSCNVLALHIVRQFVICTRNFPVIRCAGVWSRYQAKRGQSTCLTFLMISHVSSISIEIFVCLRMREHNNVLMIHYDNDANAWMGWKSNDFIFTGQELIYG